MNPLDPQSLVGKIVLGFIRHGFTTVAGGLVTAGYMTHSQGDDAVGAAMVLVGIGLSVYDKMKEAKPK